MLGVSYPHAGVSGQDSVSFITFHEPRRNESCKKLTVLGFLVFSFGSGGKRERKKPIYNTSFIQKKKVLFAVSIFFLLIRSYQRVPTVLSRHSVTMLKAAKLL